ncbi:aldo/keto reductase [Paenibacillus mucilaginosus]|uniref:Aldo/keto reductase n=2 Tax=Paenibacillus mucilaginosus TaxID=61624 RepID=H6NCJ8_9BACL|nr:aldo/keto reductase [Paenibacillus mucilaginosus]AFC28927.1 aldo/keto reductase [Paenibacillus mucilaginosus 3016]WFA17677.1 aldo/keto reductase [Paenibacillus mucilaginosus]
MRYSIFPKAEQKVSRVTYGSFGMAGVFGSYSKTDFIQSVLHALERGVNMIDTARGYGPAEQLIGQALKEWKGERPFIATKVQARGSVAGWGIPESVEHDFPPGAIKEDVEHSLRELGIDTIDLLQLHRYWPNWDYSDYWMEELERVKEEGKVRFVGVSIPDQRHDIALPLVRSGKIDSIQTVFNIFDPLPLDCLIPECQKHDVAVIARCVLDEGGLTGFLTQDTTFADGDYRKSFFGSVPREMYIERVDRLRSFIPQYAASLAELAIRFVLQHPAVTTAAISMHVPQYTEENIAAADRDPLPPAVFEELRKHHRWVRNFYDNKFW